MIMRLASFLVLSTALHAFALAFPRSFNLPGRNEIMHVTILPMEQQPHGETGDSGGGGFSQPTAAQSQRNAPPAVEARAESKPGSAPEAQVIAAAEVQEAGDSKIAVVSAMVTGSDKDTGTTFGSASQMAHGAGNETAAASMGGSGYGLWGAGAGSGSANGAGSGSSGNAVALSQARYRDTPRPEYPESARREGREGRVLLRVLVDDQGRSKKVEINSSSGSDILDRAAAEAIRRWRFHPARHGDAPTESWVNIPVDFRLKGENQPR
jgi:protein TonB